MEASNDGTAKATDIRVYIDFPEEFLLYDISDIEDIAEPEAPSLPENPIEKAEEEYAKRMNPGIVAAADWLRNFNLNQNSTLRSISALSRLTASDTQSVDLSLYIEKHSIVTEIQQIPHRYLRLLDGIYIVPTQKGKFKAEVSIMCSEYLEPIESYIDIEVV